MSKMIITFSIAYKVPSFLDYKPLLISHALDPASHTTMQLIYIFLLANSLRGELEHKAQK